MRTTMILAALSCMAAAGCHDPSKDQLEAQVDNLQAQLDARNAQDAKSAGNGQDADEDINAMISQAAKDSMPKSTLDDLPDADAAPPTTDSAAAPSSQPAQDPSPQ